MEGWKVRARRPDVITLLTRLSLRTDIPLKALNLHFDVNFSIVSQVNPHINLFFFSSRGAVGRPVTHRKGRGWRGGYLGSAIETYLKLELQKFIKYVLLGSCRPTLYQVFACFVLFGTGINR